MIGLTFRSIIYWRDWGALTVSQYYCNHYVSLIINWYQGLFVAYLWEQFQAHGALVFGLGKIPEIIYQLAYSYGHVSDINGLLLPQNPGSARISMAFHLSQFREEKWLGFGTILILGSAEQHFTYMEGYIQSRHFHVIFLDRCFCLRRVSQYLQRFTQRGACI